MKKSYLLVVLIFLTTSNLFGQDKENFYHRHILGHHVASEPLQLSIDAYPFLFTNGAGGTLGLEFDHWHLGLAGFTVRPPEFIKTNFFRNADGIRIEQNNALELFAKYYLRPDRKGLYIGAIGGPEWFRLKDNVTSIEETLVKAYAVPKIGIRVFPFKRYFYVDASFGWSFNLSGIEQRTLGATTYNASRGGFLPFLQLGARFDLTKNQ